MVSWLVWWRRVASPRWPAIRSTRPLILWTIVFFFFGSGIHPRWQLLTTISQSTGELTKSGEQIRFKYYFSPARWRDSRHRRRTTIGLFISTHIQMIMNIHVRCTWAGLPNSHSHFIASSFSWSWINKYTYALHNEQTAQDDAAPLYLDLIILSRVRCFSQHLMTDSPSLIICSIQVGNHFRYSLIQKPHILNGLLERPLDLRRSEE